MGVVDVQTEMGYGLLAEQTFDQASFPTLTRMDYYLDHLATARPQFPPQIQYLAVDGAYAKEPFITGTVALNLHVISELRRDAHLQFVFEGVPKSRGARRKYDGKVDLTDLSRFTGVAQVQPGVDLYTQVVWHRSLKRQLRLAVLRDGRKPDKPGTVLLFSTDLTQSAEQIYHFYKLRFQVEFIFRDAKQFTGLSDCQARNVKKLDFHFNASSTTLNLARLEACRQQLGNQPFVFSIASVKRRALNDPLLDTFISMLDLSPTEIKSHPNYQNLRSYGVVAA